MNIDLAADLAAEGCDLGSPISWEKLEYAFWAWLLLLVNLRSARRRRAVLARSNALSPLLSGRQTDQITVSFGFNI
jgi:hypothetical protein